MLFDLDPTSDRHGAGSEPRRVVGRACADLEFIRVAELERSLPEHLARLERACAQAHDVVAKRFFNARARHPVERLMVWRLSIEHVSSYEYEGEVLASYNEARMSPARDATQMVLDHRVDVRPSVPVMHYVDYWGTEVSAFDVHEPHDRLIVAARSLVETVAAIPDVTDTDWEVLSDENVRDRFCEYLHTSPHVPIDVPFLETAAANRIGSYTTRDGRGRQLVGPREPRRTSPARPTSRRTRGPPSNSVAASARTSSMSRWHCCERRAFRLATPPVTCTPTPTLPSTPR